jgi:hypothetical protein
MEEQQSQQTATEEKSIFNEVLDTSQYQKSMKNARIWLYVIAAFQFIMGIIEYSREADKTVGLIAFAVDAFLGIVFIGLALWSKRKPYLAFTTALVTYIAIIILVAILEPANIVRGILFKILITIALVRAIKDAKKYEQVNAL